MNAAVKGKGVDSRLLLGAFVLVGAVLCVIAVKVYEAQLEGAAAAREAEYAAEYAAFEAANPVEDTSADGAAGEDAAPAEEAAAEEPAAE